MSDYVEPGPTDVPVAIIHCFPEFGSLFLYSKFAAPDPGVPSSAFQGIFRYNLRKTPFPVLLDTFLNMQNNSKSLYFPFKQGKFDNSHGRFPARSFSPSAVKAASLLSSSPPLRRARFERFLPDRVQAEIFDYLARRLVLLASLRRRD